MIVKIKKYLEDFFRNRTPDVIIGTMDEKIAKDFFKNCVGVGFDTCGAYFYIGKYDITKLDGKWAVDVKGIIKKSYQQVPSLAGLEDGLDNPDFFHYWASLVLIEGTVLEEVCHTTGYIHKTEKEESYAHNFFRNLAIGYLEQPECPPPGFR